MATIIIQNCLYSLGHGVYQSFTAWRRHGAGRYLRLYTPPPSTWGSPKDILLGSSQETCLASFTLSLFSKAMVILEVCLESLSCWNTALWPSFWREEIMLCCSISQYMLAFMFPSMKYNSPTPAALDHDIPTTMLDCRHDTLIFVLLT